MLYALICTDKQGEGLALRKATRDKHLAELLDGGGEGAGAVRHQIDQLAAAARDRGGEHRLLPQRLDRPQRRRLVQHRAHAQPFELEPVGGEDVGLRHQLGALALGRRRVDEQALRPAGARVVAHHRIADIDELVVDGAHQIQRLAGEIDMLAGRQIAGHHRIDLGQMVADIDRPSTELLVLRPHYGVAGLSELQRLVDTKYKLIKRFRASFGSSYEIYKRL